MQLESHEVAEIIDSVRRRMIIAAACASMDDGSEEAKKGAQEFVKLINHYTGEIARAIQRAEDEKTGKMVDDMAKRYADRCLGCRHWDIPRKECGAWDQRGSSGPCDLFETREGERMTDTTVIEGHTCRYHSDYKGWQIYRAIDGGQPRMCYFGVGSTDAGGMTILTARNLSGIKDKITEARR